ncbi:hypothetical protein GCM10010339_69420 [Streptomyces alanosinicus]|uniref:Uncharacterized protein n=2 Tax=Streptomyces alanosinicus TaxID=68171 RepID=A0A919D5Z7_9ACTN|nr:hypothetical protein GCM10010339_69420 [Streptomyces alanosinicus]
MAAAGGALLMGHASRAYAVQQSAAQDQRLPEIGQTVNLTANSFGATLVVNLPPPLPRLNFIGSLVQKVMAGGPDFVRLQTLNFTLEPAHAHFGKVTVVLPDNDDSPASTLALGPTGLVETWVQSFTATFQRQADTPGPFTYHGSPTGGARFELQAPIRLGTVSSNGEKTVDAQIEGMAVNQGQLSA